MMMCSKLIIYVFAVSFQIAGAVILLLKYCRNTRQRIIKEYYPGAGIANNDGEDNAILEVRYVRECVREIYLSRSALAHIALGYALSIFGEKGKAPSICVFLGVLIATLVLIAITYFMVKGLAKVKCKEDIKIPYTDLPDYVSGTMTTKELDRIFKDASDGGQ